MAQELDFKAEDALFQNALRDLARMSGKDYGEVVKANSRLLAVNLAYQTQPFGHGDDAKLTGEKAVTRDLARVYADAPKVFGYLKEKDEQSAKAFYKAMLQGDLKTARRILQESGTRWRNVPIGPFDSSLHDKFRDRRGRVNRHVPAQVISSGFKKHDAYRKRKVKLVGFAKAGWAAAAEDLTGNTRGIPQWVTRHKRKAPGRAQDHTGAANDPHVVLHNDVSYIRTACPRWQQAEALKYQRGKMLAHVRKVTIENARKAMGAIAAVTST